MNRVIKNILFVSIIVVAILLRGYDLGKVPPSPDWDEVALGYNAYSIMQTGRDEYGVFLPVVLRSFDDYKPAAYAYTIIPFIKLIGLNVTAVRLPSVIFGVITVIAVYFLSQELLVLGLTDDEKKEQGKRKLRDAIAFCAMILIAISPWHLQFSRIAFESNVGMSINILSFLFFLKGLKNYKYLPLSLTLASLNLYMYQSTKVFVPLLFIFLIVIFRNELLSIPKKWIVSSIMLAVLIALPMMMFILTNQNALLRARGVSVFSDETSFLKRNAQKQLRDQQQGNILGTLLDNRRVEYGKAIVAGYISHFDLNWLFITGDIERHHAPYMGLMYLFELPFLLVGVYMLVFGDYPRKAKYVIFGYLLLAPIPASFTSGVPHAVRTINFIPILQIITAVGLITSYQYLKNMKYKIAMIPTKYLIFPLFTLFFIFNFLYFLNQYFVQQNYYFSKDWQYGHKEAIEYLQTIKSNYDSVIVSNVSPLDQSYIFYLFYSKYDPKAYIESGGTVSGGFKELHKGFDKYTFRPIDWDKEKVNNRTLYVGRPQDVPENAHTQKVINYLNGEPAIVIATK